MVKKLFDIYFEKPDWPEILEEMDGGHQLKKFIAALTKLYPQPSIGKIFYRKNSLENGGSELRDGYKTHLANFLR